MQVQNLIGRAMLAGKPRQVPGNEGPLGESFDGRALPGPPVRLFFWDARGLGMAGGRYSRFDVGNFGDLASASIVEWLAHRCVANPADNADGPRMLAIGSILHRAREGDVIWGTGLKGNSAALKDIKGLDVRAVRGPITYDFLKRRGIDMSKVSILFDPGSLACDLLAPLVAGSQSAARKAFVIVPHFREITRFEMTNWRYASSIVSPDGSLRSVATALLGAERVLSSSLHGIIIAEALGIPAIWLRPMTHESELKYLDYYYATDRYDVIRCDTVEDALRTEPMPLPQLDRAAMRASFPLDRIDDLSG